MCVCKNCYTYKGMKLKKMMPYQLAFVLEYIFLLDKFCVSAERKMFKN